MILNVGLGSVESDFADQVASAVSALGLPARNVGPVTRSGLDPDNCGVLVTCPDGSYSRTFEFTSSSPEGNNAGSVAQMIKESMAQCDINANLPAAQAAAAAAVKAEEAAAVTFANITPTNAGEAAYYTLTPEQEARVAASVNQSAYVAPASAYVASQQAQVSLDNLTRPGSSFFYVGERFRVTVQGAPGQPVSVTAGSTSLATSTSTYGSTNSQGLFSLDGQMGTGEIGTWRETWRVGDIPASPNLVFDVIAAPASASQVAARVASDNTTASVLIGNTPSPEATVPATGFDLSTIPTWAYLAGGGLVLFMLMKGK